MKFFLLYLIENLSSIFASEGNWARSTAMYVSLTLPSIVLHTIDVGSRYAKYTLQSYSLL